MVDERGLDSILDSGLVRYAGSEPLEGLEQRILQRVRTQRRRYSAGLVGAFWCALMTALALVVFVPRTHDTGKRGVDTCVDAARTSARATGKAENVRIGAVHKRSRGASLFKQPEFPARTPLTPDERALLQIGTSATELAISEQPIKIEPIEVSPITIVDSGAEYDPSDP
jgi:hypothetical protein